MEDTKDFILHKDRGQKLSPMNQENPGPGHGYAKVRQELAATVPGQSLLANVPGENSVYCDLCSLYFTLPLAFQDLAWILFSNDHVSRSARILEKKCNACIWMKAQEGISHGKKDVFSTCLKLVGQCHRESLLLMRVEWVNEIGVQLSSHCSVRELVRPWWEKMEENQAIQIYIYIWKHKYILIYCLRHTVYNKPRWKMLLSTSEFS